MTVNPIHACLLYQPKSRGVSSPRAILASPRLPVRGFDQVRHGRPGRVEEPEVRSFSEDRGQVSPNNPDHLWIHKAKRFFSV